MIKTPTRAASAAAVDMPRNHKKILVVEDEKDLSDLITYNLQRNGYDALSAADGPAALELAAKNVPDLVLLDLMLPDIDGRQILERLQKDRPQELRNILVLTGDLVSDHEDDLKAMGVDAVCPKPVDIPCLLSTLAAAGMNLKPGSGTQA